MLTQGELASQIENRILFRTYGRVRHVHVELGDHAVVLHGNTSTYYAKQLAQRAVSELLPDRPIANAIEVG